MSSAGPLAPYVSRTLQWNAQQGAVSDPVYDWRRTLAELPEDQASALGLRWQYWQAPLQGVAHVEGQFKCLATGAEGGAPVPANTTAEGLLEDLQFLLQLRGKCVGLFYDRLASESDYHLVPVILELPQGHAGAEPGTVYVSIGSQQEAVQRFREPLMWPAAEPFLRYMRESHLKLSEQGADANLLGVYAAFESLAEHISGPVTQVFVGVEGTTNPIVLLWAGKSRAGNLLGLASGVIWT